MKTGRQIGRYEIIEELGRGGMATVYRALDTHLQRHVALKLLAPYLTRQEKFVQRFERETQVIVKLEHANIVPVYDAGVHKEQPFLIMRLLEGGSLRDKMRGGPMPPKALWPPLRRIAAALDAAHNQGIVHRDLKPTNILFDEDGAAFVSDFGIAKLLGSTTELTGSFILGSPPYMSPEQLRGGMIDGRSDQYNLAIVIFHLLSGRLPFEGDTVQLMYKHLHEPPPPLHALNNSIPPALSRALERALAKSPEARYSSITNFISALERASQQNRSSNRERAVPEQRAFVQGTPQTPDRPPRAVQHAPSRTNEKRPASSPSPRSRRHSQDRTKQSAMTITPGAGGDSTQELKGRAFYRHPAAIAGTLFLVALATYFLLLTPEEELAASAPTGNSATTIPPTAQLITATPAEEANLPRLSVQVVEADGTARWHSDGQSNLLREGELLTLPLTNTLTVETGETLLTLRLSDDTTIMLAPDTRVTLQSEGGLAETLLLRGGTVVLVPGEQPLTVTSPYGAEARSNSGILGVRYTQSPFAFVVSCLTGDCIAKGDLSGEEILEEGKATVIGGSGQPSSPQPVRYEEYTLLTSMQPSVPTMTATPSATATPTPTSTATPTMRPPMRAQNTPTPAPTLPPPPPQATTFSDPMTRDSEPPEYPPAPPEPTPTSVEEYPPPVDPPSRLGS